MKLLVVESPAKAKTIGKYLGKDFVVRASVGHVRDLPKSNKRAVDIDAGFVPHYEIAKGKEHVVEDIANLAKKADEVLLATDPDREGEAIAWHVAESAKLKKPKRIVFHEITKEAVQEALAHPRTIDLKLKEAQEARRVLDRLVGYDLSGLIWKKVRYGLSAGRVQSPALRIVMEREREIRAFVPEQYFVITADTATPRREPLTLTCEEEPRDKAFAERIAAAAQASLTVGDVTESAAKRSPRPPFTTSTLQQAASSRLGFSPSRTMATAQKLYEAGLITYMRTDSTTLAQSALGHIATLVTKTYGQKYLSTRQYKTTSKNAQEAHEGIRPTDISRTSAGSTEEQKRLYHLIHTRTIASQMADAELLRTKIVAGTNDAKLPNFSATGSRVVFDGWLKADPAARGEDVELPAVTSGEKLTVKKVTVDEKSTEPPSRYTEAGLVKELEKRGIGRPSTYASIIKTLQDRGYVEKQGRALKPTDTGDVVSTFLENNFNQYISDTFTAEMENELDEIARGEREYAKTLSAFYKPFSKEVAAKGKEAEKITDLGPGPKEFPCPKCGAEMNIKLGKNGKFLSCVRFPECDGGRTMEGEVVEPTNREIGKDPETGLPIVLLSGKFGPYVQVGEPKKVGRGVPKPRRASLPKDADPAHVTLADALKYLSLPRTLGTHPDSGKPIVASVGRFGPYVMHDGDFRSLKKPDDVYAVTLERALEIFKEEKKKRGFARRKKTN